MARTEIAVAELMWNLIAGKTGNIGRVDFQPQKPFFHCAGPAQDMGLVRSMGLPQDMELPRDMGQPQAEPLPRAVPESQGISSAHLAAFLGEMAAQEGTDIHQILVARHGKVICECGFAPYPAGLWHASYSLCKSVTGMAVGMLVREGKLRPADRVSDFFRKKAGLIHAIRQKEVTVEHLLTMTSCVDFNETGILSGNDWVRGFLDAGLTGTPGKDFEYNSMNSYMLSAIVTEVTGESMMEYLRPRLWEPLGITQVFWESCPMGITKGGWGLFLRPEDAARLGILYLNGGSWEGRQLVDGDWVKASCTEQVQTPGSMSTHGYGYQMWMGFREGAFNYNGMLGQNVVAYPDLDLVVVTNAGSHDLFQNCALMKVVKKYFETGFEPPRTLAQDPAAYALLTHTIKEMEGGGVQAPLIRSGGWRTRALEQERNMGLSGNRGKRAFLPGPGSALSAGRSRGLPAAGPGRARRGLSMKECLRFLDGRHYDMAEKHVGLMPLMMQVMHNNYTDGIGSMGFEVQGNRLFLLLQEGEEESRIEIGFDQAARTWVSFHGEPYLLGVKGELAEDEDARLVLKLDFAFLEEACRRRVKLHFQKDRIEACWDETPGKDVIMEGLDAFTGTGGGRRGFLMNAVKEVGGIDVFHILVERTVQPVCHGVRTVEKEAAAYRPASEQQQN